MSSDDKGKFHTDIGQDVINAALESVRKHTGEVEVPVEVAPAGEAAPTDEVAAPALDDKDKRIEELTQELEFSMAKGRELMAKIKDEHEKMLRASADLENFKKRANKEREDVQKFGIEKLLKDFIPVVDNFDRALEHANKQADLASFEKGVLMVKKLFEDTLGKHGVKAFDSKGKPFDPNFHEAMGQQESAELPPNHVAQELVRGFTLNDRLVRPALVMVTKAPAPPAPPEPAGEPEKPA